MSGAFLFLLTYLKSTREMGEENVRTGGMSFGYSWISLWKDCDGPGKGDHRE